MMQLNVRPAGSAGKEHPVPGLARRAVTALLVLCSLWVVAVPASATGPHFFPDVRPTEWFCADVSYASRRGIVRGDDDGMFRPNDPVTRGEFVTMLARLLLSEQYPEALPESPFVDVSENRFYTKAVLWACSSQITNGTSDTTFSPNDHILRQDMATMIYRAEALPELGELPELTEAFHFADEADISLYAKDALLKLQLQGVLKGNPDGCVKPKNKLTRAEAVTVLTRIHLYLSNHSHVYGEGEITKPSCTAAGLQYYNCECGSYYAKAITSALGHSYQSSVDYNSWTKTYTCSRCGHQYSETLPPQRFYDGSKMLSNAEILSTINKLQAMYPGLISSYSGGKSVNGAEIRVVKLGKGSRYIFMNGNLHGNEAITTNYLLKVLDEYAYAYATNGSIGSYKIKTLLDKFSIVMIPCSNPDGRSKLLNNPSNLQAARTNARGVNLNRNFPTNWVKSSESGSSAASEPETKAIINVLSSYKFEVVLDCHNSGNYIYYADYACGQALMNRSKSLANAIRAACGYGMGCYDASAGMANYARHPYGVPGLTVEMCPGVDTGHNCSQFPSLWSLMSTMPAIVMNFLQ